MRDYPVLLRLQGALCVVVGGGPVGRRKAAGLLAAGARVRLVAGGAVEGMETDPALEVVARPFRAGDLAGARLAFAATDERRVNEAVAAEARRLGIPVNLAEAPDRGDFTLPAVLRRGELTLAVGTGGASPALAAELRDRLATLLGPEWGEVVALFAALRQKRLTLKGNPEYNREIVRRLLAEGLAELVADGDAAGIARLLQQLGGGEFSPAEVEAFLPRKG